ncbi:MAG: TIGR01212 family radical SAM protein [Candidatus Aminicenantaceae bacterium]
MMRESRYRRFSKHLKQRFGCRVYKVALDAGLSCPNRDGTVGDDGCLFCDPAGGSGRTTGEAQPSVTEQMRSGMVGLRKRYKAERFIAYFQSFTNTYGSCRQLKTLYDQAVAFEEVVGLSIATRPDCLSSEVLDLIQGYARGFYTWVELGVQSMREETLRTIARGHDVEATAQAVRALRQRGIFVCAHLILGLPGEDLQDMTQTVHEVSALGVDAVKFHMLYVTRFSRLAQVLKQGNLRLLEREEYITTVIHLLEHLAPDILVQRLVSEAHRDILVAPDWLIDKSSVIREIEDALEARNTHQGALWGTSP